MSCHRFQIDLSRCLDGRLPGARRAEVMTHLDQCPKCEQVWADIQAAQSIIFGLDQPRVGTDFRDQVWERIHSGEGAPEVLLQEPVTTWSKVRYGMIGAAAAAAVLFTLHLVLREDAPVSIEPKNVVENPALTLFENDRSMADPLSHTTLTASHVARATAQQVTTAAKQLRRRRDRILSGSPLGQPLRRQVDDYVRTIDDGLQILHRLEQRALVTFGPSSHDCLTSVRNSLRLDADPVKKSYNLVRTLTDCSLDSLDQQLKYIISVSQIRQQGQVIYSLFADPHFRPFFTDLRIIQDRGTSMMLLQLQNSGPQSGLMWTGAPQQFRIHIMSAPTTPAVKRSATTPRK